MRATSLVLFGLTAGSSYLTGGWRLMVAALAILVAHEMGHLLACRYYRVPSTWPFFIPAPVLNPFAGTLGAVMLIQSRFPSRCALFDIGVAGPLAGLATCILVLWLGANDFTYVRSADVSPGTTIGVGVPFLYRVMPGPAPGEVPAGTVALMGPLRAAAWFGLLLTGLNLIPIGQFDGGHVLYALFPRHAHRVSRVMWCGCLALIWLSPSWIGWAVLTFLLGRPHPATLDDQQPLGLARKLVGVLALVALIVCFIPEPMQQSWPPVIDSVRSLFESLRGFFTSR